MKEQTENRLDGTSFLCFLFGVCFFLVVVVFEPKSRFSLCDVMLVGWGHFRPSVAPTIRKTKGIQSNFMLAFCNGESTTNKVRPYISRNLPVLPPSQRQIRGGYENFCFVPWTTKKTRGLDNLLSCTLQYLHLRESKQSPGAACHSCRPNAPSSNKHPKKKKPPTKRLPTRAPRCFFCSRHAK